MREEHLLYCKCITPLDFHFIFEKLGLDFDLTSFGVWGDLEVTHIYGYTDKVRVLQRSGTWGGSERRQP